jgi:regulator of protease activity HflC (stomatin/prohibitin superfamily)
MPFQNLPPHLAEILRRVNERIQALYSSEENRAQLRAVIILSTAMVLLLCSVIIPNINLLEQLSQSPEFDPRQLIKWSSPVFGFVERLGLAVLALEAVFSSAILALHTIYELSTRDARARILVAFARANRPLLNIRDGKLDSEAKDHPLICVGGPGIVNIASNTAIITETVSSFCRVLGPGDHVLGNFERIRAVIDLRPQRTTKKINTQTKDGIPIQAEGEIEFQILPADFRHAPVLSWGCLIRRAGLELFCLFLRWAGLADRANQLEREIPERIPCETTNGLAPRPPFPFFDRAVINAYYGQGVSRHVSGQARLGNWRESVPGMVMSRLETELIRATLDRLNEPEDAPLDQTLPHTHTPRWEIERCVLHNSIQGAYRHGCVVTNFMLGQITLDEELIEPGLVEKIKEQRDRTWRAEWERRAQFLQGLTEAEVTRLRETARAEVQAQIIQTILHGLPATTDRAVLRRMLALRTIEVLERVRQTTPPPPSSSGNRTP